MSNTMSDLREEVASRLRNSLHGREIDMMESIKPRIPHMIGVTPLGKTHDPNNEEMSLLDTSHPFWQEYDAEIRTQNQITQKIETAIRSLKEDGIFRMTHPYGEEADVIYCEVDKIQSSTTDMKTTCKECGTILTAQPDLDKTWDSYQLSVSLDCPNCDFDAVYGKPLRQLE